ncbi:MAG: TadE/TadG family type IV pilus assembly protein [Pseudomonadota bacterium]|jgi:Flp pilus assembly pilin Flp|uniref:TadE/TadG family type IV pilus assembly protein n=1 Tax=Qipengyuania flava TaxID=192812 RepID=UPI001CD5C536|nr:TadE/TadG family type IV pilus assembly protein [Qipengyuania flava]MCA0890858.1 pilus assembly protein [Qipengyuania flava]MEC9110063.1 TadE/TadG family type IV pilus assembly protein [Pseudomonadota bacterium]
MRRCPNIRRLGRDQRGATIVEFAVIAMPMCVLLMGGLELGYNSYVRSTLQGALHDAARVAAVENPILATEGDTVEEQVANMIKETVAHVAPNAVVDVDQKSYFEFSSIGEPEKLMTDNNGNGKYDASDEDCFEDANGNGTFDPDSGKSGTNGGADDVVLYTAKVSAPRILPLDRLVPGVSEKVEYTLRAAVRNQPYGQQPTAPVICG